MKNSMAVKAMLLALINEMAAEPEKYSVNPGRDFTRNRKLGLRNTLLLLLTMEADSIKEELYLFFGRNKETPSKAAFCRQRKKLRAEAIATLMRAFNRKLEKNLYDDKYQLFACDGSSLEIWRNPDDAETFCPPTSASPSGFNRLYINACFSILDRRFTDFVIQRGKSVNEYDAFCKIVDNADKDGPPIIYIADMGYASYNNFAHVIENGQFFLIRCNDKRLRGILGESPENRGTMDEWIHRTLSRSRSEKKHSRKCQEDRYRFVDYNVPMDYLDGTHDEYDISLRVVRFEISSGNFVNIITNLPDDEFSEEDFMDLYHLRWKQEGAFRDLKYPLCLRNFHSRKADYVEQEIWARAILYNFSSVIASGVKVEKREAKHVYHVNFSEAARICRDFLRSKEDGVPMDVEGLIRQNVEPVRYGRAFERKRRYRHPISFCYRC